MSLVTLGHRFASSLAKNSAGLRGGKRDKLGLSKPALLRQLLRSNQSLGRIRVHLLACLTTSFCGSLADARG